MVFILREGPVKSTVYKFGSGFRVIGGGLLAAAVCVTVGCGGTPVSPAPAAGQSQGSLAIRFDTDSTDSIINGSEVQLTAFDGVSQLSYNTTKGPFVALLDTQTIFRSANLNPFTPTDPCRQYAINYNTAGPTGDTNGLFAAISAMAASGCVARIHVDRTVPPNPVKSFRPTAGF